MNEKASNLYSSFRISPKGLVIRPQGQPGRLAPAKGARALKSFDAQTRAQVCVVNHTRKRPRESLFIKRVYEQTGIAHDFRQARSITGDDGRAALHRLKGRQTEALEV